MSDYTICNRYQNIFWTFYCKMKVGEIPPATSPQNLQETTSQITKIWRPVLSKNPYSFR